MSSKVFLKTLLIMVLLVVSGVSLFYYKGVKINLTPSLPQGIYTRLPSIAYNIGDIVSFPVPDNDIVKVQFEKYPGRTLPKHLIKVVYGVAGDSVHRVDNIVLINDQNLPLLPDVPTSMHSCIIPDGYVFVGTPHERSFDSRYYGLIHVSKLSGTYKKLLTI